MLQKGLIIKCPKCGIELYRVKKTVHDGSVIKAKDLEPISATPVDGQRMECGKCLTDWLRLEDGRVYTNKGWIS
jgi:hypothetical protein